MNAIYLLIPLSLILLGIIIWAFFWAVKNKQFDNIEAAAFDILREEDTQSKNNNSKT